MSRYKKNYQIDGWPIEDTHNNAVLSTDDLVVILNRREWVGAEHRLPEPSDAILMSTNNGAVYSGRGSVFLTKLSPRDAGEGFVSDYYTHWQLLPAAPNQKQ